jgi:hypothetical protein
MAISWLAKVCLAVQNASRFSTPTIPPPIGFPNKIAPSRASVRRRNRLAYALLPGSVDVSDDVKCCLPKLSRDGVITEDRLDDAVGLACFNYSCGTSVPGTKYALLVKSVASHQYNIHTHRVSSAKNSVSLLT